MPSVEVSPSARQIRSALRQINRAASGARSGNASARVIARAMQKYGMYMADGGNIALTGQSDVFGCATWDSVGVDPSSLAGLKATDFEVIDHGPTVDVTFDCQRALIME